MRVDWCSTGFVSDITVESCGLGDSKAVILLHSHPPRALESARAQGQSQTSPAHAGRAQASELEQATKDLLVSYQPDDAAMSVTVGTVWPKNRMAAEIPQLAAPS